MQVVWELDCGELEIRNQELGIKNIEYMQGDILKLDQLDREFDIVECVGVLHHMDDPLAGWKVLVGMLRRGGLMKIGLYSEIARQNFALDDDGIGTEGLRQAESLRRKMSTPQVLRQQNLASLVDAGEAEEAERERARSVAAGDGPELHVAIRERAEKKKAARARVAAQLRAAVLSQNAIRRRQAVHRVQEVRAQRSEEAAKDAEAALLAREHEVEVALAKLTATTGGQRDGEAKTMASEIFYGLKGFGYR